MITIQDIVEEIIKDNVTFYEVLGLRFINASALAKEIQPLVEKKLLRKINLNSIIVAIVRLKKKISNQQNQKIKIFDETTEITLRTNFTELVYSNEEKIIKIFSQLKVNLEKEKEFFAFSKGFYEITFVAPQKYLHPIIKEYPLFKKAFENLSVISIKLPEKVVAIPGVYYRILQFIAYEKIPLVEIFSTYTEFILIVNEKFEDQLLQAIKKVIRIL